MLKVVYKDHLLVVFRLVLVQHFGELNRRCLIQILVDGVGVSVTLLGGDYSVNGVGDFLLQ